MTKYRNPQIEAEMAEDQVQQKEAQILEEPAETVQEEIWKTRYADSRRGVAKMQDEHRKEVESLRAELNRLSSKVMKTPASEDELDDWMAQYPETARIVEGLVQKRIDQATSRTNKELERIKAKEADLEVEAAFNSLRRLHPDVDDLLKSADFRNFVNGSKKYQEIMNSLDVENADLVINKFKAQNVKPKAKVVEEDDRFEAAKVVRTTKPSKVEDEHGGEYDFSESQIEALSKRDRHWFEKNEMAIHQALLKGRVLMDISGGAR